jgi:hypothetical protein
MKKVLRPVFRLGCLVSVVAPIVAVIFYPRANWLFAFLLLGIALIAVGIVTRKPPTTTEVADRTERLLNGTYGGWDADDYPHLRPKNKQLRDLWLRTMSIGGLPEEWIRLDDETKGRMREVIAEMRRLPTQNS